jgi:hypothetical protein
MGKIESISSKIRNETMVYTLSSLCHHVEDKTIPLSLALYRSELKIDERS